MNQVQARNYRAFLYNDAVTTVAFGNSRVTHVRDDETGRVACGLGARARKRGVTVREFGHCEPSCFACGDAYGLREDH